MTLGVVDLFCGAGGLSEGFRQAGFQILAGCDIDPDACASYAANFPEAYMATGDLRGDATQRLLLTSVAHAAVIVGGPPCQAFSQVRNHVRLIDDPRNSLYREFVRIVGKLRPIAFVMENVQGLEQMGVKQQIAEDLTQGDEYTVNAQVLDAADFGVPQTRKRLFFIGLRRSLNLEPPVLTGTGATTLLALERQIGAASVRYGVVTVINSPKAEQLSSQLLDPQDTAVVGVQQAISDLRFLAAGRRDDRLAPDALPPATSAYQREMRTGLTGSLTNTSVPRINTDTSMRLAGVPQGGNYRDLAFELRARYLTGERWGPHNGTGKLGRKHYYAYRRLHADFWSWTLNTKADAVYHYQDRRSLSVREFARLQSFPDRFVITTDPRKGSLPGRIEGGAAHSMYRQVGNAVPPLLAKAVAIALQAIMAKIPHARTAA